MYLDIKGNFVRLGKIIIRDFSEVIVPEGSKLVLNDNVFFGKFTEVGANDIHIGQNTSFQNNCILLGNLNIGKNCLFASNVYLSSGKHYFDYKPELLIKDQDKLKNNENINRKAIHIDDDVWVQVLLRLLIKR